VGCVGLGQASLISNLAARSGGRFTGAPPYRYRPGPPRGLELNIGGQLTYTTVYVLRHSEAGGAHCLMWESWHHQLKRDGATQ
jgi:hypothetical protein